MGEVTEQIILSILNHSRDTNEVNELISAYFETFGVTKQQYKKYDYTKLNSVLLSKGFTSMEQVVAALSAKMAALDSDTSVTPAPSGGGGGGGGGNSGSVGTYVPPVKNVDDEMTFTDVDSNAWYYHYKNIQSIRQGGKIHLCRKGENRWHKFEKGRFL